MRRCEGEILRNKPKVLVTLFSIELILIGVTGILSNSLRVNAEEPWSALEYDSNNNGIIEKSEAIRAMNHYEFGYITKYQLIEVLKVYFGV